MAMGWHKLRTITWWIFLVCFAPLAQVASQSYGRWELLLENGGVSAMHMTLTHQNTVIYFDKTDVGPSGLVLPHHLCRRDPQDTVLEVDCWAHSVEYNLISNKSRGLEILTDPWCSSGSFVANGTLVQTGGWNDGTKSVRYFSPCPGASRHGSCYWVETSNILLDNRWYATNQILPDDRIIIVGGRRANTYEFIPRSTADELAFKLPLLEETFERGAENNLYPFVHLSSDGNLFIFANRDSILLNYQFNEVVKRFPQMPGEGSRNYPSSGSSAILPLEASDGFQKVEVIVCGGSSPEAYQQANLGYYLPALNSCGRLIITDDDPEWMMETMPSPRVMSDMIILPTGDMLLINGAESGTAGWGNARDPILTPFLYRPSLPATVPRWQVLTATTIPRMYHSSAVLLTDGRILVGGSNTNRLYDYTAMYPTELRLETFSPDYLDQSVDYLRPRIQHLVNATISYGSEFQLAFDVESMDMMGAFEVRLYAPAFSTHSNEMNQRQLLLEAEYQVALPSSDADFRMLAFIQAPPGPIAAPAGYYMLFVLHAGVPSVAQWVRLSRADDSELR